jgi:hypothetical protein
MKTVFLVIAVIATGCYSPNLSNEPFACGSDTPQCPDGYDCMSGTCVKSGGNAVVQVDAGSGSSGCPDEPAEPNNSYTAPFVTPVASQFKTWKLTGLAICPAGDIDVYALTTNAMQTLTASITYGASGEPLDMQLLDSNGMTMKNGTAMQGMTNVVSASVADLPTNMTYYVFVQASTAGNQNTYSLDIAVTP